MRATRLPHFHTRPTRGCCCKIEHACDAFISPRENKLHGMAAPPARANIALIQIETRSLVTVPADNGDQRHHPFPYWRKTAKLNAAYACKHGYDYIYYRMRHHPARTVTHLPHKDGKMSKFED